MSKTSNVTALISAFVALVPTVFFRCPPLHAADFGNLNSDGVIFKQTAAITVAAKSASTKAAGQAEAKRKAERDNRLAAVAKRAADEFAATVKGVAPTQINAGQAGGDATQEFWRTGTEDVLAYQNWGTNSYTRNAGNVLQAAGVDLTGISVPSWIKPSNHEQLIATAISPLHVISAAHWHPTLGEDINFIDASNQTVTRQVVAERQIIDPRGGTTDLWVAKLSAPLPESIKPFKVLPGADTSILQTMPSGIPVWLCQGGKITVSNLWTATGKDDMAGYQPNPSKGFDENFTQHSGAYSGWNTVLHSGSGSPIFIVIDHEPVLLSILHYMNGNTSLGGPSVTGLSAQINAAMAALQEENKPYRLTETTFKH
ncbi:MAG: hypothetical protein ABSB19_11820 [Methylomonas sp.]